MPSPTRGLGPIRIRIVHASSLWFPNRCASCCAETPAIATSHILPEGLWPHCEVCAGHAKRRHSALVRSLVLAAVWFVVWPTAVRLLMPVGPWERQSPVVFAGLIPWVMIAALYLAWVRRQSLRIGRRFGWGIRVDRFSVSRSGEMTMGVVFFDRSYAKLFLDGNP